MPTAELSPSAGGPDTREAFVALSLDRSNAGPSAPGDGNLAARWDFEGGGEVIADSSPARANNGVLRSDKPERAPGIFGSALDFSRRINCEYFDVPKWSGAGDEFTLSIWLKIKPVPGAALGRLTYTLLSGDGGSSVVIRDHLLQLKSAKPKMTLGSNRLLNPFEWTHAAVTVSGSGTQIYINGRPAGESKARFSLPPAGGLLRVGSAMTGQFHLQFRGSADNIEIRREALSPGEIMGLYKKGLDRTHANNKSDEKGKTQ
jgi:hypothetical protein